LRWNDENQITNPEKIKAQKNSVNLSTSTKCISYMEFGALPLEELENRSFALPADPPGNATVLKLPKPEKQAVYVGCAKWGRKEWVGKLYPQGLKEKDFLEEYAKHYNSIELNATTYKFPTPFQISEWVGKVHRPDFRFAPKAHQSLSFPKSSANKPRQTEDFIRNIRSFGGMLGPVFITISSSFKEADWPDFSSWLRTLPTDISFFVEVRDPKFFSNAAFQQTFFDELRKTGIGAVITDTAGRPDVLHMQLTIPKAFIRFVGNSLHPTDYPRIDNWVTRLKQWLDQGIQEVYFFMHMHDEGLSPELSRYVITELNKKCNLNLDEIRFVG
jgi:uncharacterized protein YecE (DUF72 family)